MTTEVVLGVVVGVLVIAAWVAIGAANRLDRLHQKVARTGATLDAQLLRRAAAAAELAASGLLDPASSLVVADAAARALESGQGAGSTVEGAALTPERGLAESELSQALRQALGSSEAAGVEHVHEARLAGESDAASERSGAEPEVVVTLEQCWHRSQLARRFYNDAVAQARRMRSQLVVRALHLAGRAAMPVTFEMDDATQR